MTKETIQGEKNNKKLWWFNILKISDYSRGLQIIFDHSEFFNVYRKHGAQAFCITQKLMLISRML